MNWNCTGDSTFTVTLHLEILNNFFGYDRLKFIELTRFVMCVCVWERRREKETHTLQVALCMSCMHCHSLIRRINFAFVYASQVAKKRLHLVFGGVGCNIGDLNHLCCYFIWHGCCLNSHNFTKLNKKREHNAHTPGNMASILYQC